MNSQTHDSRSRRRIHGRETGAVASPSGPWRTRQNEREFQQGAKFRGLNQLTPVEFARLHQYNEAYKDKFGFPFLYAVKGSTKLRIMQALETRLLSSPEDEFQEALQQVYRIARFRFEDIIGR